MTSGVPITFTVATPTLIDALMARSPDVILIPGDLFQGTTAELQSARPALRDLLGRLSAPGGFTSSSALWMARGTGSVRSSTTPASRSRSTRP